MEESQHEGETADRDAAANGPATKTLSPQKAATARIRSQENSSKQPDP